MVTISPASSILFSVCSPMVFTTPSFTLDRGHTVNGIPTLASSPVSAGVLQHPASVVNPLYLKDLHRLPDVVGRSFLPGVGDRGEPGVPGLGEHPLEFTRRIPGLRGVQPDSEYSVPEGHGLLQGVEGVILVQVPEEAHDEPRGYSEALLPVVESLADAATDLGKVDTPGRVGLGVEEDLGVPDGLGRRLFGLGRHLFKVGGGEVVEVRFGAEDCHALVVDFQKLAQAGEPVGVPGFAGGVERDGDVVPGCELDHQLRFEGSFDVEVEFGLGQVLDERGQVHWMTPYRVYSSMIPGVGVDFRVRAPGSPGPWPASPRVLWRGARASLSRRWGMPSSLPSGLVPLVAVRFHSPVEEIPFEFLHSLFGRIGTRLFLLGPVLRVFGIHGLLSPLTKVVPSVDPGDPVLRPRGHRSGLGEVVDERV